MCSAQLCSWPTVRRYPSSQTLLHYPPYHLPPPPNQSCSTTPSLPPKILGNLAKCLRCLSYHPLCTPLQLLITPCNPESCPSSAHWRWRSQISRCCCVAAKSWIRSGRAGQFMATDSELWPRWRRRRRSRRYWWRRCGGQRRGVLISCERVSQPRYL